MEQAPLGKWEKSVRYYLISSCGYRHRNTQIWKDVEGTFCAATTDCSASELTFETYYILFVSGDGSTCCQIQTVCNSDKSAIIVRVYTIFFWMLHVILRCPKSVTAQITTIVLLPTDESITWFWTGLKIYIVLNIMRTQRHKCETIF